MANFGLNNARSVVLVGSGSGARGAARNCDFLAEAVATVNPRATVRCVLDGADYVPYWVQAPDCRTASRAEAQKFLWSRQDDESCLEEYKDRLNSTELAEQCGMYSK